MTDPVAVRIGRAVGKPIGFFLLFLPKGKRKTVFVWLFGIFLTFLLGYSLNQAGREAYREAAYRSSLTPIRRAELDRERGHLALALQDLDAVNQDSLDYDKAQALKDEIQNQIENRKTPQTKIAERNCRELAKDQEEFPSTVRFKLFGTDSVIDRATRQITVTVDYTAKNSMGAELPYRLTCVADYDGDITHQYKVGR